MQRAAKTFSKTFCGLKNNLAAYLGVFLLSSSPVISAQMAPMQLTNPAVDSVVGDNPAAWIADENMGVLYCELIAGDGENSKRVMCFDSNGAVTPGKGITSNR